MQSSFFHFDIGELFEGLSFAALALGAWKAAIASQKDFDWRVKNLETWRIEHMVDSDARDKLLSSNAAALNHLRWQTQILARLAGIKIPKIDEGEN